MMSLKMEKEKEKEKEKVVVEEEKVAVVAVMAVFIWRLQEQVKVQPRTCALEKRSALRVTGCEGRCQRGQGQEQGRCPQEVKIQPRTHALEKGLTHVNVWREALCGHGWLGISLALSLSRALSLCLA